MNSHTVNRTLAKLRYFVGGSDARIIMSDDEAALLRLWREKRGEIEPEDLSGNLIVRLGVVTEPPAVKEVQRRIAVPGGWGAALTNPETSMVALGDNGASLDRVWPEEHHSGYLRLTRLAKAYAQPSPIFVYEFDAGGLDCSLQLRPCFIRNPRAKSTFKSLDGRQG